MFSWRTDEIGVLSGRQSPEPLLESGHDDERPAPDLIAA